MLPQRRKGIKIVPSSDIWERIRSLKRQSGACVARPAACGGRPKPNYVNELGPIRGQCGRPGTAISAPNVPLVCRLAAHLPPKCPRKSRMSAACPASLLRRYAAEFRPSSQRLFVRQFRTSGSGNGKRRGLMETTAAFRIGLLLSEEAASAPTFQASDLPDAVESRHHAKDGHFRRGNP